MENANVAIIKSLYDAFGRGDIPFIMGNMSHGVSFEYEAPATIPYSGTRHGVEQAIGFFEGIGASEKDMNLVMNQYIASGDEVASFGRYDTTVKSSGKRITTPVAHYWEFKDGKVVRFMNFINTAARADAV